MRATIVLVSAALAASCGRGLGPVPPRYEGPMHADIEVRVSADPSGWLTTDIAVRACALWRSEGVRCVAADSPETAEATVTVSRDGCAEADGLPIASSVDRAARRITIFERCLAQAERRDGTIVMAMLGHQFGHLLGIAGHAPDRCADDEKGPCGRALMNGVLQSDFAWITPTDDLLFQARDAASSVGHPRMTAMGSALTLEAPRPAPPDCRLTLDADPPAP